MTLRFNYTGRKAIPRDMISVTLSKPAPDGISSFDVTFADVAPLGLPADARVFVEPYVGTSSMRFDYGAAGALVPPSDRLLTEIDQGRSVLFRLLVVDATAEVGKIIASAEAIAPVGDDESRDWLLPLVVRDLGEAVWDLEEEAGSRPRLVLNSRFPGIKERLLGDPLLMGAIFPSVLRRILLFVRDEDENQAWAGDWRCFVAEVAGEDAVERIFDAADPDAAGEEIEVVCERFLARRKYVTRAIAAAGSRIDG